MLRPRARAQPCAGKEGGKGGRRSTSENVYMFRPPSRNVFMFRPPPRPWLNLLHFCLAATLTSATSAPTAAALAHLVAFLGRIDHHHRYDCSPLAHSHIISHIQQISVPPSLLSLTPCCLVLSVCELSTAAPHMPMYVDVTCSLPSPPLLPSLRSPAAGSLSRAPSFGSHPSDWIQTVLSHASNSANSF